MVTITADKFEVRDIRDRNWFYLDNELLDRFGGEKDNSGPDAYKGVGVYAIAVYVVLARMANNNDQSCFPSHTTIGNILNIGRSTVIRTLEVLEKNGLIRIERRAGDNNLKQSNVYYLLNLKAAKPETKDAPMCHTDTSMSHTDTTDVSQGNMGCITQTHKQYSENNTIKNNTNKREKGKESTSSGEEVAPPAANSLQDTLFGFDTPAPQEPIPITSKKKPEPKAHDARLDHPAVKLYKEKMHLTPDEAQREQIINTVTDLTQWGETLDYWKINKYRPQSVGKIIDCYAKKGYKRDEYPQSRTGNDRGTGMGRAGSGGKAATAFKPDPDYWNRPAEEIEREWAEFKL